MTVMTIDQAHVELIQRLAKVRCAAKEMRAITLKQMAENIVHAVATGEDYSDAIPSQDIGEMSNMLRNARTALDAIEVALVSA